MAIIFGVDPGATRTGWSILGPGPTYIDSGVIHHPRLPNQKFQEYRMELTKHWVGHSFDLLDEYKPDVLVSETVPSRGAPIMDQLYLASVQIATLHAIAISYGVKVVQVSARSVQSKIAKRRPGYKVTKAQLRSGVLEIFPELKENLKGSVYEASDAIGIALFWYKTNM